jgi:glycosyltransferase involved in cell wall biosynthesis
MKVLHITPHLGGGIGKALAAISKELPKEIKQEFILLEKPIDQRCVGMLRSMGHTVEVAPNLEFIWARSLSADIVQVEFINHPRLLECIARTDFPDMRCVFWAHISGLHKPILQPKLMEEVTFVFSSAASLYTYNAWKHPNVINSGFGFNGHTRPRAKRLWPRIAYLGTVNFIKMHPSFCDIVDNINHVGPVLVWGHIDKAVEEAVAHMKHPQRVELLGETLRPAEALAQADIFLYPLQPKHYGTGENALVEAMSMGLVPVVMNNLAEKMIVTHNKTGLVAESVEDCIKQVDALIASPTLRERLSNNAKEFVAEKCTPKQSADQFVELWGKMMATAPKHHNFKAAIGNTPLEWFLATQQLRGIKEPVEVQEFKGISKGSLAHFQKVFAGDPSFNEIRL